jgi:hypothetical protein
MLTLITLYSHSPNNCAAAVCQVMLSQNHLHIQTSNPSQPPNKHLHQTFLHIILFPSPGAALHAQHCAGKACVTESQSILLSVQSNIMHASKLAAQQRQQMNTL